VAARSAALYPGHPHDGVRSLDNLEAGVFGKPERVSCVDRFRVHVPRGEISNNINRVSSWIIIAVVSSTWGAGVTELFYSRGR
jgi:hypothetical protein